MSMLDKCVSFCMRTRVLTLWAHDEDIMNSHTRALNLSGEIKKLIVVSPEGFDVQHEPQMRKPIAAC